MPSAYLVARDNIEQVRAILANDAWFDAQVEHLLVLAISRLQELDHMVALTGEPYPGAPSRDQRRRQMPWLNP